MRLIPNPLPSRVLACAAVLATAGTLTSLHVAPPADSMAAAARGPLTGVLRTGIRRFTEADIELVVNALHEARIDKFVLTLDPQTGSTNLELGEDLTPHLDLKPGSCPNSVNVNQTSAMASAAAARITTGVVGNAFDVTQVDVNSLRASRVDLLYGDQGVTPVHFDFSDIATPFIGRDCACAAVTGDGILDLLVQFDREETVDKLELDGFPTNAQVPIRVTGLMNGGRVMFAATDCLRVIHGGTEE